MCNEDSKGAGQASLLFGLRRMFDEVSDDPAANRVGSDEFWLMLVGGVLL